MNVTQNAGNELNRNTVTVTADDENNAEVFWANLQDQHPGLAEELRRGEVVVDAEVWSQIQLIEGFSDGPSYAPTALVEV